MYVHNLNPVALEFFGLKIYWYSLAYLLGFIFSIFYSKLLIKKGVIDLDTDVVDNFFSWAIIGVIFGGRLGYVIFYNFEVYIQNYSDGRTHPRHPQTQCQIGNLRLLESPNPG